ncbi:MAG TPA: hypothetical protein VEK06_01470, partial [Myxococcota bacterium]|nr:hypothetical protein [Myxococcota bacterium]
IFHHWHVIRDVLMVIGRDGMLDLALTALSLMKDSHDQLGHVGSRPLKNIRPKEIKDIIEALDHLAREIDSNLGFDPYLRQCLRKKAVITLNLASSFGLSGSFLRANRNLYDNRPGSPGYMSAPTTQLADGGDTWARFIIRIREILASIEWLKQHPLLKEDYDVPDDFLSKELFKEAVFPLAFGQVDAPEGDVKISIFIDKKSNKLIYRIRTPAYFIAQALPHLLSQADLKDLPLILYSLGITAEEIDR